MNNPFCQSASTGRTPTATLLILLLSFIISPVSVDAAQSVQSFLRTKPRWNQLVGTTFRIEGRVAVGGGNILRLDKLPLFFVSDEELPELRGPDLAVEVVGRLRKTDAGILEFELLNLQKTESDVQRVNRLRVDLPRNDPEPWYELGDWAMNRVRFYQSGRDLDKRLTREATELYRMALRKERTRMESPSYQRLKELAIKSEKYGLGAEFKLPLLYEAHVITWHSVRNKATSSDLAGIAIRIAQELPEADRPLNDVDDGLVADWRNGPVTFYLNAPDVLRPQLHRILYQHVMLESIERDAASDGRNGDEIAAKIEDSIPEFNRLAAEYRSKKIEWKIDHINELSRAEALALKQELIDSGNETRAEEIFRRWFDHVEQELRKKGADGLIELADEYETLFDDGQTAVQLLLESDRLKQGKSYVAERLEGYGYTRIDGRWRLRSDTSTGDASPIEKAIRDRRVIRGMTSAHVRKAIGKPDAISRVLTSREVIEYWLYKAGSDSKLSIRLSRPVNRHEGVVRDVFDLPAGRTDSN